MPNFNLRQLFVIVFFAALIVHWASSNPIFLLHLIIIFTLYLGKWMSQSRISSERFSIHVLLCLVTLPFLYSFAWDDGHFLNPLVNWIGLPVAIFAVPTFFLIHDLACDVKQEDWAFVLRSAIEIVVVTPIWFVVWLAIQFALGWIRI